MLGNYPQGVPRGKSLGVETQNGWVWAEALPPRNCPEGSLVSLLERSQVFARARRHWVAGAAVVAALAAAAAVAVRQGWLAPRTPLTIAVLPVQSQASDDAGRLASTAIEDAVVTGSPA